MKFQNPNLIFFNVHTNGRMDGRTSLKQYDPYKKLADDNKSMKIRMTYSIWYK